MIAALLIAIYFLSGMCPRARGAGAVPSGASAAQAGRFTAGRAAGEPGSFRRVLLSPPIKELYLFRCEFHSAFECLL